MGSVPLGYGRRIATSDADLERRHRPDGDPSWRETWEVDLVTSDGAIGAYLRTTWWPGERRTACWAALVGDGRPLVTVVEHEGPPLGPAGLDLRAEGLWADQICEIPLTHWTVGLEAFGVALDDPVEAFSGCRGDRTALGLDVEWESDPSALVEVPGGYELACRVEGEVLVGAERIDVAAGWGRRRHTWGPAAAREEAGGGRLWGRLDDGTVVAEPSSVPLDRSGLPAAFTAELGPVRLGVQPRHHAPVGLPDGRRLHRSLARAEAADGRHGHVWVERWVPPDAGV